MFDTEAHRPYRELMRELRLEREWADGDYFIDDEPERVLGGVRFTARVSEVQIQGRGTWGDPEAAYENSVWLPRLDQLMVMLEEAFTPAVEFHTSASGYVCRRGYLVNGVAEMGEGRTREEAAARLWCAVVKGWKVT